jgi:hypothetical protein
MSTVFDELEQTSADQFAGSEDHALLVSPGANHHLSHQSGPVSVMTRARVLAMALPIIGENLLQTSVGAVDTLMVARLGKESVAGVGTAAELVFFIISILMALYSLAPNRMSPNMRRPICKSPPRPVLRCC